MLSFARLQISMTPYCSTTHTCAHTHKHTHTQLETENSAIIRKLKLIEFDLDKAEDRASEYETKCKSLEAELESTKRYIIYACNVLNIISLLTYLPIYMYV